MQSIPENYVAKRETKTRPASFGEAWAWSLWAGIAAAAATIGLIMAIESGNLLWVALTIGAGSFYLMLDNRKRMHDERAFNVYESWVELPEPTTAQPVQPVQPWIVQRNGTGQRIEHGKFTLLLKEWQTLAKLFLQYRKISRAIIAESAIWKNVTAEYPEIQAELIRLGLFDSQNGLTELGREFFQSFLTPSPTPLGNGVVHTGRPTTTDDDGQPGGVVA